MTNEKKDYFPHKLIAGMILCLALVVWFAVHMSQSTCEEIQETTGNETKFKIVSGCYVKVDGIFIPIGNWRNLE